MRGYRIKSDHLVEKQDRGNDKRYQESIKTLQSIGAAMCECEMEYKNKVQALEMISSSEFAPEAKELLLQKMKASMQEAQKSYEEERRIAIQIVTKEDAYLKGERKKCLKNRQTLEELKILEKSGDHTISNQFGKVVEQRTNNIAICMQELSSIKELFMGRQIDKIVNTSVLDNTIGGITLGSTGVEEFDFVGDTANTADELYIILEMERNGEFECAYKQCTSYNLKGEKRERLTEEPIVIDFSANTEKYDLADFLEQGEIYENELNLLSVADYLRNYESRKIGGRAGDIYQKNYRLACEMLTADRLMEENSEMNHDEAMQKVKEMMKNMDVLHGPDQIMGGFSDNT